MRAFPGAVAETVSGYGRAAADPMGGRMAGWTPADPGPLGLAGFAGSTFMLSMINAGLVVLTLMFALFTL